MLRHVEVYDPSYEPPEVDAVYHFTSTDRVNGEDFCLLPNPDRGRMELWKRLEELIDSEIPQALGELGISRKGAVYANPTIESFNSYHSWGKCPTDKTKDRRIAIEIEVDPRKAIVCSAGLLEGIQDLLRSPYYADEAHERARSYWDSALTLADFRKIYDTGLNTEEALLKRGAAPPRDDLRHYSEPEVLIRGPIDSKHLRIVAMGRHYEAEKYYHDNYSASARWAA